jgi:hypothetical protein
LIGPSHILTAGHVIVELSNQVKHAGPIIFVLPDGRRSRLTKMEVDAGWKKAGPNYDIAVCTLSEALGKGGHAAWGIFDDSLFGSWMHVTGYDKNLASQGGLASVWVPRLVDRKGLIQGSNQMSTKHNGAFFSMTTRFLGNALDAEVERMTRIQQSQGGEEGMPRLPGLELALQLLLQNSSF